jgi:demethoxyubiquinone hydroxylase (CLK1/Coq7/Cat5 family)
MLSIAFAALGFLVGNLTGLSASPIANALVPALFALVGGSFIAFLSSVPEKDRGVAAWAIMSFSVSCLAGAYLGILVNANQVLGPHVSEGYLRHLSRNVSEIDVIDQRKRAGELNAEQAYEELRSLVRKERQ